MQRTLRRWANIGVGMALLCSALMATQSVNLTTAGAVVDCSGRTWPSTGHVQTTNWPGSNEYWATFQFSLTANELCALQAAGNYLEIDFRIRNFNVPDAWEGYDVYGSNLPGGIHDVAADDKVPDTNPAITRIYTFQLTAGPTYYATIHWKASAISGQVPYIFYVWTPSHWAMPHDPEPTSLAAQYWEYPSCVKGGNNPLMQGSIFNANEAWCIFPNAAKTATLFGNQHFDGGVPDGTLLLSGFRWYDWNPTSSALSSSTTAPAGTPPVVNPSTYTADRTILHGSDGSLWVMAGGAKFYFGSMSEFSNLGYSTNGMVDVSTGTLNTIPNMPRNGTVLRSGGGQIYAVAGGAKFQFGSMTEYYSQGYANNAWINVPQTPLDQMGDAPGNKPANGTVIQHPNGSLYVVVGGVKFQFGSMTEYHDLGYTDAQVIRVPAAPTNGLAVASTATPTRDGTVLRSGGGQIYVVAGGAKFHFGTVAELNSQGYTTDALINVPQGSLDAISDAPGHVPGNGTVVLRPDGALFVITGGVRWQFGTMAEFSGEGYGSYTPVSQAPLDGIYDASASHLPADETLIQGTGSTLWVMKAGVRRSFTSMAQFTGMGYSISNIVRVPDAVLNGIPNGGELP
jgi:hypothetical protein